MPAATAEAKIGELLEEDERRHARDSYRAAGGSKRRPLKSFLTTAEKKEMRVQHAALIREAVEEIREPVGFERWLETLELNPQLTPMNAALVAMQTPGQIVSTCAQWKRQGYKVRKGETAAGRLTGKGFWPLAYFTAEQASAGDLADFEVELPSEEMLDLLRAEMVARLDQGDKARETLIEVAALRAADPSEFVSRPETDEEATPKERDCKWCGGEVAATAGPCPLSFTCPTCQARPGEWCKRPSEHRAPELHVDRLDLEFNLDRPLPAVEADASGQLLLVPS